VDSSEQKNSIKTLNILRNDLIQHLLWEQYTTIIVMNKNQPYKKIAKYSKICHVQSLGMYSNFGTNYIYSR